MTTSPALLKIIQESFDVGVHGLAFNEYSSIKKEYNLFNKISNLDEFGIRIHDIGKRRRDIYLTLHDLKILNKAQFLFSSNWFTFKDPFKVDTMWEFPIHIMDGYIFDKNGRWKNQKLEQTKQETEKLLHYACENEIRYFNILFHDSYFSNSFKTCREWYCWFVNHCKKNGFQFMNYKKAIQELEKNRNENNKEENTCTKSSY